MLITQFKPQASSSYTKFTLNAYNTASDQGSNGRCNEKPKYSSPPNAIVSTALSFFPLASYLGPPAASVCPILSPAQILPRLA